MLAAHLDVARTVVRRAERGAWAAAEQRRRARLPEPPVRPALDPGPLAGGHLAAPAARSPADPHRTARDPLAPRPDHRQAPAARSSAPRSPAPGAACPSTIDRRRGDAPRLPPRLPPPGLRRRGRPDVAWWPGRRRGRTRAGSWGWARRRRGHQPAAGGGRQRRAGPPPATPAWWWPSGEKAADGTTPGRPPPGGGRGLGAGCVPVRRAPTDATGRTSAVRRSLTAGGAQAAARRSSRGAAWPGPSSWPATWSTSPGVAGPGRARRPRPRGAPSAGPQGRGVDGPARRAQGPRRPAGRQPGLDQRAALRGAHLRPRGEPRGHVALVGKGVTFDTGGYSLKTGEGMKGMNERHGRGRRRASGP